MHSKALNKQTAISSLNILLLCIFGVFPLSTLADEEIFLGAEDAPVTLIEYGSLTCGHCVRFHFRVFPKIANKYIDTGRVKFIFRDYPTSIAAQRGAVAARCAGDQYYTMLDRLFKHVGQWSDADEVDTALVEQAVAHGIPQASFTECLSDPAQQALVTQSQQEAKTKYGVTGTPTFLINGKLDKGIRKFKELDALLKNALIAAESAEQ